MSNTVNKFEMKLTRVLSTVSSYRPSATKGQNLINVLMGHDYSFASPEADFQSSPISNRTNATTENSVIWDTTSTIVKHQLQHKNSALMKILLSPTSISFATPETDLQFDSVPINTGYEEYIPSLSYASPESDFTGFIANYKDEFIAKYATTLSFASPESDFIAPNAYDISGTHDAIDTNVVHNTHVNYASPESDYTSIHISPFSIHTDSTLKAAINHHSLLSFASPESDFCGSLARAETQQTRNDIQDQLPTTFFDAYNNNADAFVVTKLNEPFDIVHVNTAWEELCGYKLDECQGKTLSLIQGPKTDLSTLHEIASNIARLERAGISFEVSLVNYTKNGEEFNNQLRISVIEDAVGEKFLLGKLLKM